MRGTGDGGAENKSMWVANECGWRACALPFQAMCRRCMAPSHLQRLVVQHSDVLLGSGHVRRRTLHATLW